MLDLINEILEEKSESGDVDADVDDLEEDYSGGYHSDSESCVMTSGNSPFISKEARFNFLSRSGKREVLLMTWAI